MAFIEITNAHGPSCQPIACRFQTYSLTPYQDVTRPEARLPKLTHGFKGELNDKKGLTKCPIWSKSVRTFFAKLMKINNIGE